MPRHASSNPLLAASPSAGRRTSAPSSAIPRSGSVKGKDLFDSILWNDPSSTTVFYKFIASLRGMIRDDVKQTTATHRFIRLLRDQRKLVRCYTQNIDGLETREGLSMDICRGKGNRQRFSKKAMAQPTDSSHLIPGGHLDGGCEVVPLHGDLETLRCTLCHQTCPWTEDDKRRLLTGKAPYCQLCLSKDQERQDRGKRGTKVGTLRPNIVLYGENHPKADALGAITTHDLSLSPDVLLVLGTSLRVHGLKTLVREFAKSVHARPAGKGKVIFVNLSRPSDSLWKDSFDYWVSMDCDEWVLAMRRHRPDLFQRQEPLKVPVRKRIAFESVKKPLRTTTWDEDKENVLQVRPVLSTGKPCVVIPETPKKQRLIDLLSETSPTKRKACEQASPDPSSRYIERSSQLLTPPLSRDRTGAVGRSNKRPRAMMANADDLTQSPSKRRRREITIWEDQESLDVRSSHHGKM